MNAVRAFEAAARHSSFLRAAEELFVTPGAVSRQVRILEATLGKPLFERNYREVRLTESGRTYARAISDALGQIDGATREFLAADQARSLHIHVPMAFALLWLMPRLSSFHKQHPRDGLRLASAGNPPANLVGTDYDVAIKRIVEPAADAVATRLFDVELVPICCPTLRDSAGLRVPRDLAGQTLLYSTARPADWSTWLASAGVSDVEMRAQVPFHSTSLSCQAAMNGLGIAIIPRALAEDHLSNGDLVLPIDVAASDGSAFYAIASPTARNRLKALTFCEWIANEAAEFGRAVAAPARRPVAVGSGRDS